MWDYIFIERHCTHSSMLSVFKKRCRRAPLKKSLAEKKTMTKKMQGARSVPREFVRPPETDYRHMRRSDSMKTTMQKPCVCSHSFYRHSTGLLRHSSCLQVQHIMHYLSVTDRHTHMNRMNRRAGVPGTMALEEKKENCTNAGKSPSLALPSLRATHQDTGWSDLHAHRLPRKQCYI